jgi:hypothetical protein
MPEQRYLDALVADLEAALPLVWGRPVHSIFIGGGTPSLFSPQAIDRLLADIRARLKLEPIAKSRWRPTPAPSRKTASAPFARPASRACRWACRASTTAPEGPGPRARPRAGLAAVEEAAQAFDTFNLDLMYALPGQTWPSWSRPDARRWPGAAAHLDLPPDHRAQHLLRQVSAAVPDEDTAYAMLDRITEMTGAAGLARYEVSAYARPATAAGTTSTTGSLATTWALAPARTASSALPHRVVRQVRFREPKLYMDNALAGPGRGAGRRSRARRPAV